MADLAVDDEGTLYLYYYGWTVGDEENIPAMAISEDDGATWTFKFMEFEGFPNRGSVADPCVNYEDGIFRLYGSTNDNGQTYILYGESTDGSDTYFEGNIVSFEDGTEFIHFQKKASNPSSVRTVKHGAPSREPV